MSAQEMTVKSLRSIETKNGTRHIMSLSAPAYAMALADNKGLYNIVADADGVDRTYRPDVTLFVADRIAEKIAPMLADGETLVLQADKAESARIDQSAKGSYFIPAETVMSDPKSLKFSVIKAQTCEFDEAPAHTDSDCPF